MARNTQADDALPSIVGRGDAYSRTTPWGHTQLLGGAPLPRGEPPSPAPLSDPPASQGASGRQLVGGVVRVPKFRGRPPPPPPRGREEFQLGHVQASTCNC